MPRPRAALSITLLSFALENALAATVAKVAVITPTGHVHAKGRTHRQAMNQTTSSDERDMKSDGSVGDEGSDIRKAGSVVRKVNKTETDLAKSKAADLLLKFRQFLDGKTSQAFFHYNATQRSYADSVSYCQSKGYEIANVRTKTEQDQAASLIGDDRKGFMGANNDGTGTWTWRGGWPWAYAGPNKGLDGKDVTKHIVMQTGGMWTEVPSSFLAGVLCRDQMFNVLNPEASHGMTMFFAAHGKCFKVNVGDSVKQGSNVPDSNGDCLASQWHEQYSLGTYKNTTLKTQFFTGGSQGNSCPNGASFSSNLALYKSSNATSVQAVVDEGPTCNFAINLVGPESAFLATGSSGAVKQGSAAASTSAIIIGPIVGVVGLIGASIGGAFVGNHYGWFSRFTGRNRDSTYDRDSIRDSTYDRDSIRDSTYSRDSVGSNIRDSTNSM